METVIKFFGDTHHLILFLLGGVLVALIGKQLGPVLAAVVKKEPGVNVNIKEEQAARICKFTPAECNAHLEEKSRSLQNKEDIAKLEAKVHNIEVVMYRSMGLILRALVKASLIEEKDIPKELT